jgi:hypothetical protein
MVYSEYQICEEKNDEKAKGHGKIASGYPEGIKDDGYIVSY